MKKKEIYILSNAEYKLFEVLVQKIDCPDLNNHDCSVCPMNININYCFPKEPDYRCLLSLIKTKLHSIRIMQRKEEDNEGN